MGRTFGRLLCMDRPSTVPRACRKPHAPRRIFKLLRAGRSHVSLFFLPRRRSILLRSWRSSPGNPPWFFFLRYPSPQHNLCNFYQFLIFPIILCPSNRFFPIISSPFAPGLAFCLSPPFFFFPFFFFFPQSFGCERELLCSPPTKRVPCSRACRVRSPQYFSIDRLPPAKYPRRFDFLSW